MGVLNLGPERNNIRVSPDRLPPMCRLVAVVVTHNRLEKLKVTLARLLEVTEDQLAAVVVVDNASADGTQEWLAGVKDPRLDVVHSADNIGGAGGFETGMRHAVMTHDPDWLVLMDDDARPVPGALEQFHAFAGHDWDALAAAVYFPAGDICEMNRPSRNPFWHRGLIWKTMRQGRDGFHIPHSAYTAGPCPIDVTSFVGFFIARRTIEKCGYPDGRLFLYGDDSLYTLSLSRAGGRIAFVPGIRFEHDFTTFSDADAKGQRFRPLWKLYYHHRNLLLLYRMAAGWWFAPACVMVLAKWVSKIRYYPEHRMEFFRLIRAAIFDGLRRNLARPHAEILEFSGENLTSSECPGDSDAAESTRAALPPN